MSEEKSITPLNPAASEWKPNVKAKEWLPTKAALEAASMNAKPSSILNGNVHVINEESPANIDLVSEESPVCIDPVEKVEESHTHIQVVEEESSASVLLEVKSEISKENEFTENSSNINPIVDKNHIVKRSIDADTESKLYDIARLLSLRPTEIQPPRPPKLNPPPNLNILWDGSLEDPVLSTRSIASTMSGGSGFTTPRGDPGSRPGSTRNMFGMSERGMIRQGSRNDMRDTLSRRESRSNIRHGPTIETASPAEECAPLKVNVETRWKAKHMISETDAAVEEAKEDPEVIMRRAIALLNKMTLEKFEKLSVDFVNVGFTTTELVDKIISILVEKAQAEPHFAPMYAQLCLRLSTAPLPAFGASTNSGKEFRKMLLEHCQEEFGKERSTIIQAIKDDPNLGPEEKAEKELLTKNQYTGHMRFVGELFIVGLLRVKVIHYAISDLLGLDEESGSTATTLPDEEKLDCMVKLMSTVGKNIDEEPNGKLKEKINRYFQYIKKLSEDKRISSRLRFMLRDLIDLRKNEWVPRRELEKAKTLAQIHYEVAKEEEEKARKSGLDGRRYSSMSKTASVGQISGSQDARVLTTSSSVKLFGTSPASPTPQGDDDGWETVPVKGKRGTGQSAGTQFGSLSRSASSGPKSTKSKQLTPGLSNSTQSQSTFSLLATDRDSTTKPSKRESKSSGKHKDKDRQDKEKQHKKKSKNGAAALGKLKLPETPTSVISDQSQIESDKHTVQIDESVTEEKARRAAQCAVKEYVMNKDIAEALHCFRELHAPQHYWAMVSETFGKSLESGQTEREGLIEILIAAGEGGSGGPEGEGKFISHSVMAQGCASVVNYLADLVIDVPQAVAYAAKILGSLIGAGVLPISFVSPEYMKKNMGELVFSTKAMSVAVRILAEVLVAVGNDMNSLQSLAAMCTPPLTVDQLAMLQYEEDRTASESEIAEVQNLLQTYSISL